MTPSVCFFLFSIQLLHGLYAIIEQFCCICNHSLVRWIKYKVLMKGITDISARKIKHAQHSKSLVLSFLPMLQYVRMKLFATALHSQTPCNDYFITM